MSAAFVCMVICWLDSTWERVWKNSITSLVDELDIIGQKYTHRSTRQNSSQIKAYYLSCQYSGVVGSEKCSVMLENGEVTPYHTIL